MLTSHEPGNEIHLIPEVAIPGGCVDYFLVSVKENKVMDFVGIELQTLDTTGTVWPERQRLLIKAGLKSEESDIQSNKKYGINWKMTAKTILIQMHHKAETFENINKHLVLVIQNPFLEYMKREFAFAHMNEARLGDSVHIHAYDLVGINDDLRHYIKLSKRISTDAEGIAKSLGLQAEAKIELQQIIALLESKISLNTRLTIV